MKTNYVGRDRNVSSDTKTKTVGSQAKSSSPKGNWKKNASPSSSPSSTQKSKPQSPGKSRKVTIFTSSGGGRSNSVSSSASLGSSLSPKESSVVSAPLSDSARRSSSASSPSAPTSNQVKHSPKGGERCGGDEEKNASATARRTITLSTSNPTRHTTKYEHPQDLHTEVQEDESTPYDLGNDVDSTATRTEVVVRNGASISPFTTPASPRPATVWVQGDTATVEDLQNEAAVNARLGIAFGTASVSPSPGIALWREIGRDIFSISDVDF